MIAEIVADIRSYIKKTQQEEKSTSEHPSDPQKPIRFGNPDRRPFTRAPPLGTRLRSLAPNRLAI